MNTTTKELLVHYQTRLLRYGYRVEVSGIGKDRPVVSINGRIVTEKMPFLEAARVLQGMVLMLDNKESLPKVQKRGDLKE